MAAITGNYQLVKNENWLQNLLAFGMPEEKANAENEKIVTLEVVQDGDKISIKTERDFKTFVINEEVEEKIRDGNIKSLTKLNGNVLTITSTGADSPFTREFTFSDSGVVLKFNSGKKGVLPATRTYKRI